MTGFGRSEILNEDRKIIVEIKAVNHRYMDLNIKMPRKLSRFEAEIRNLLKDYISRGKVDIYITYEDYTKSDMHIKYNREVAAQYIAHFNSMSEEFGLSADVKPAVLGKFPEVFTVEEQNNDEDTIWENLKGVIEDAAQKFVESRVAEGENLKADMLSKLDNMLEMVSFIEEKSPEIITEYKAKLIEKIDELAVNTQIDEQRIATEVTLFADKVCVDEELVRLRSHIEGTRNILEVGGPVGRKLDFIVQEMNREANTILSKSNSLQISDTRINLKTDIEKVREQIQNIE